jgi:hypothetical protein
MSGTPGAVSRNRASARLKRTPRRAIRAAKGLNSSMNGLGLLASSAAASHDFSALSYSSSG